MSGLKKYVDGLAMVLDNLPQAVVIVDKNLDIQYVNALACDFFGYSEKELTRLDLSSLINPKHIDDVRRDISNLLSDTKEKNGKTKMFRTAVINKGGSKYCVNVTLAQIKSSSKELDAFLRLDYIPPEVSEGDYIEKQVQDATVGAELINALNFLEDSIVMFDDKWRYEFVNEAGWKVLNREKDKVLGKNVWELRPDLDGSQWKKAAIQAMETQKVVEIEEYYEGSKQWYISTFYPTSHSLTARMQNITVLKETQRTNDQLLGTLEDAMEAYWSDANRSRREKQKR